MYARKIITSFLILVMVLQFLPVRQAVRYFFIDNVMVEEILHIDNNATKTLNFADEDKTMPNVNFSLYHYQLVNTSLSYYFTEQLPTSHAAEIQTPPPNTCLI